MKIFLRFPIFKFTVLLVLFSHFSSQLCYAQAKQGFIVLSGTIKNVAPQPDGKKTIELSFPFSLNRPAKKINLDAEGSFRDTIANMSGMCILLDGNFPIYFYLSKSKTYHIAYDADQFRKGGKVILGGDDIAINRYYIEKAQQREIFDPSGTGKTEAQFKEFAIALKTKALDRVNKATLPKELVATERKAIQYEYLFNQYLFIALRELDDPSFKPSAATLKEFVINYNNEKDYITYNYYRRMVYEYYMKVLRNLEKKSILKDPSYSLAQHRVKLLAELVPNQYIKNYLIYEMAMFDMKAAKDLETFYTDFKKYYTGTDEKFKNSMANAYQSLVKLKKGTPSPEFVDYINYKGGTNSLKDYRGKYVYIDLWATWCGNCWNEMPYLKELEHAYEGKNIVFVSISLDEDIKEWAKTVKEKAMDGIQLLVKQPQSSFIKEYAVNGIPRYIFLDPEGKIIAYNAPRPSDKEKLEDLFKSVGL
ncbi:TlpA disulfide reductase family protein [Pedobacter sp. Hv1]|uniref:TlpA family protein disulfide reductase n=1 Tax=Pedobacter sp. Hv1 TaxID=1740090 RepID=UPI0006D8CA33|nr:TlpA disulfide reductase family protein [Pedobacter sp. Hv1]KQC00873.1 hypothetical protein AQF98_09360 [Pedobacter sp. Hv1]